MSDKKAPVVIKRDSAENWAKATNYIPVFGTICIYDKNNQVTELKIGDGVTNVNQLPNILPSNPSPYVQDETLNFN